MVHNIGKEEKINNFLMDFLVVRIMLWFFWGPKCGVTLRNRIEREGFLSLQCEYVLSNMVGDHLNSQYFVFGKFHSFSIGGLAPAMMLPTTPIKSFGPPCP